MWNVHTASVMSLSGSVYTFDQLEAWANDDAPEKYMHDMESGSLMLVAEHEGQIIGFSCLYQDEVEALYVHPAHSGHRAGHLLLEALEWEAALRGIERLHLDASMTAVAFYQRRGYEFLGYTNPKFDAGDELPCARMCKALCPSVQAHELAQLSA